MNSTKEQEVKNIDYNKMQSELKSFLSIIMDNQEIKSKNFKFHIFIHDKILNNCFNNLRQENEETEICIQSYKQHSDRLNKSYQEVFKDENVSKIY